MGSTPASVVAAALARLVVVTANIPLESLRIRLSNEVKNNKLNFHGYKIMLVRDLPFSAIFWTTLEWYRNSITKGGEYRESIKDGQSFAWRNFTSNMVPGLVLGSIMSAVTTPLDTLKTRIQSKGIKKYSILVGLRDIYAKEGARGLFSGMEWRVLKNGVHSSLYVFIYEWYMRGIAGEALWE
jgi:hypothetical protein